MSKEQEDGIKEHFSRFFTAYCLSSAILEDYTKVVAKIEGVSQDVVEKRIKERAKQIGDDVYKNIKPSE